jgi:hypothetical protein
MWVRHWRFILGVFWLGMAIALFFRDEIFPGDVVARFRARNLTFGAWLGLLLAGWNLARWYQAKSDRARRAGGHQAPLRPRPDSTAGYEYNPEFDFQKMDREGKENPPGRNGAGH